MAHKCEISSQATTWLKKIDSQTTICKLLLSINSSLFFGRIKASIVSIYQPHLRPIVRGKAKAKVEFGAKIGASIVNGYTYVDHLSWDAYNESSDLAMQLELYKKRFGMLPQEVQADKLYLGKANRNLIKDCHVDCYNHPLGQSPKDENDCHAEDKKRAIGERNEVEATFGTSKRVYRANDIRAKLDDTADTWIGACFFAKNVMKFLR